MIIDLSRIKTIRLVLVHLYLKKVGVGLEKKLRIKKVGKESLNLDLISIRLN